LQGSVERRKPPGCVGKGGKKGEDETRRGGGNVPHNWRWRKKNKKGQNQSSTPKNPFLKDKYFKKRISEHHHFFERMSISHFPQESPEKLIAEAKGANSFLPQKGGNTCKKWVLVHLGGGKKRGGGKANFLFVFHLGEKNSPIKKNNHARREETRVEGGGDAYSFSAEFWWISQLHQRKKTDTAQSRGGKENVSRPREKKRNRKNIKSPGEKKVCRGFFLFLGRGEKKVLLVLA